MTRPGRGALCAALAAATALWAGHAAAGAYDRTGHGDRVKGPQRLRQQPRGSCRQCHSDGAGQRRGGRAAGLWRDNDDELCFSCHDVEDGAGPFPGRAVYEDSSHGTDPRMRGAAVAFGRRRRHDDRATCLRCHDPHGKQDRAGLIPNLLRARDETLCLECHDGTQASADIARELRKPYGHGAARSRGGQRLNVDTRAASFGYAAGKRYAACSDCHNAHAAVGDLGAVSAPVAPASSARVSRISVVNGAAGTVPRYDYRPANDVGSPVLEYEICFKCHSSWTTGLAGTADLGVLLNPNNASFHPVEGPGKNASIDPMSLVGGLDPFSVIYCGDCHGSDDPGQDGPHGSRLPHLLRSAYNLRGDRPPTRDDLCFRCHNFDTYANPGAPSSLLGASRFNPPTTTAGHAVHVGERRVSCYACHDSHGAPRLPALLATGRVPGLTGFTATATGGQCRSTCHGPQRYQDTSRPMRPQSFGG